jgi:hypothetical protein
MSRARLYRNYRNLNVRHKLRLVITVTVRTEIDLGAQGDFRPSENSGGSGGLATAMGLVISRSISNPNPVPAKAALLVFHASPRTHLRVFRSIHNFRGPRC